MAEKPRNILFYHRFSRIPYGLRLLVDFINLRLEQGEALSEVVTQAAATHAKSITLKGLAVMLGVFFILDDPIFNGLAISLIFGILVSTLLTLVLITLCCIMRLSVDKV